jgi:hypothetical protein
MGSAPSGWHHYLSAAGPSFSITTDDNAMQTPITNTEDQRWTVLSDFVKRVCADRDESHGYEHMKAVAETSRMIVQTDFPAALDARMLIDVITAAWLHDVADHKYDKDGTLDAILDDFGYKHIDNFDDIKKVIKLVSYSSENKAILSGKPLNYEEHLGSYYTLVRHVVSDADKLEALGKIGIERTIEYTKNTNPGYSNEEIVADVKKHADEKLLRLADEFIRTPTAIAIARVRHNEMLSELAKL